MDACEKHKARQEELIRSLINRYPRIKRHLRKVYYKMHRENIRCLIRHEPLIFFAPIDDELIRACLNKIDPIILNIGCNDGAHALWLNGLFERARVYCFEPDPRAIRRFRQNVGNVPNVLLFEMALSDQVGECLFYQSGGIRPGEEVLPEGWDQSGSIRKPTEKLTKETWLTFDTQIQIKTLTLDAWCADLGIEMIDFIWMDVQGAEMDVFRGGQKALRKTRYIYTEYNNCELYEGQATLRQILKYLNDFKVIVRYPYDILLKNRNLT